MGMVMCLVEVSIDIVEKLCRSLVIFLFRFVFEYLPFTAFGSTYPLQLSAALQCLDIFFRWSEWKCQDAMKVLEWSWVVGRFIEATFVSHK